MVTEKRRKRNKKKRQRIVRIQIACIAAAAVVGIIVFVNILMAGASDKQSASASNTESTVQDVPESDDNNNSETVSAASNESKSTSSKTETISDETKPSDDKAVIMAAGDVIVHSPFLTSSFYFDGTSYNYDDIFKYVSTLYNGADFAFATAEFTIGDGDYQGYPCFVSPNAMAQSMKNSGIDMCLLAHNHIYDNGDFGVSRTMDYMEADGITYAGVRRNAEDKNYIIEDINGIRVGFLDYAANTGVSDGHVTLNGIVLSDESAAVINTFDEAEPQSLYDDVGRILEEMQSEGVEYTICGLHWGAEYDTSPDEYQPQIAQQLCDMGIDAIIGSHPHVVQGVDVFTSSDGTHQMLCCYSIGNLLSNQRTEQMGGVTDGYSEDGLMVQLGLQRTEDGTVCLNNAEFIPAWVYHNYVPDNQYYILPLNNADEMKNAFANDEVTADIDASLARTNGIISEGVAEVLEKLPLT